MPIQDAWAWTQFAIATAGRPDIAGTGRVTGSVDITMPTQLTVYASTAIQRLRVVQAGIGGHAPPVWIWTSIL
jgi:hypothetical protein